MSDDRADLALRIDGLLDLPAEDVIEVMAHVDRFQRQARELKHALEDALVAYIDERGEIVVGDRRWYVGVNRTYKPKMAMPDLLAALMDASGGDFDTFAELLASGAFKPGACREVLGPERFGEAFDTVVQRVPETGKPKRVAKVADTRFSR